MDRTGAINGYAVVARGAIRAETWQQAVTGGYGAYVLYIYWDNTCQIVHGGLAQ